MSKDVAKAPLMATHGMRVAFTRIVGTWEVRSRAYIQQVAWYVQKPMDRRGLQRRSLAAQRRRVRKGWWKGAATCALHLVYTLGVEGKHLSRCRCVRA